MSDERAAHYERAAAIKPKNKAKKTKKQHLMLVASALGDAQAFVYLMQQLAELSGGMYALHSMLERRFLSGHKNFIVTMDLISCIMFRKPWSQVSIEIKAENRVTVELIDKAVREQTVESTDNLLAVLEKLPKDSSKTVARLHWLAFCKVTPETLRPYVHLSHMCCFRYLASFSSLGLHLEHDDRDLAVVSRETSQDKADLAQSLERWCKDYSFMVVHFRDLTNVDNLDRMVIVCHIYSVVSLDEELVSYPTRSNTYAYFMALSLLPKTDFTRLFRVMTLLSCTFASNTYNADLWMELYDVFFTGHVFLVADYSRMHDNMFKVMTCGRKRLVRRIGKAMDLNFVQMVNLLRKTYYDVFGAIQTSSFAADTDQDYLLGTLMTVATPAMARDLLEKVGDRIVPVDDRAPDYDDKLQHFLMLLQMVLDRFRRLKDEALDDIRDMRKFMQT